MGAIDWNTGNQNYRKPRTDVFPDQGDLSITEPLLAPLPLARLLAHGHFMVAADYS